VADADGCGDWNFSLPLWACLKYAPRNRELESLEKEAPEPKKGLLADPHPVPPWE